MIIGITGPSGAGKTTALHCLEKMGFTVYDCDAIYHRLLAESDELNSALLRAFPTASTDGRVDRKKLGAIVFGDEAQLNVLNAISHKAVRQEITYQLSLLSAGSDAAIDAVELIGGGLGKLCDVTFAVLAPKERRIERIMQRDSIDRERAALRVDAQKPDEYYIENCAVIINNDFDYEDQFSELCAGLFRQLKEEYK